MNQLFGDWIKTQDDALWGLDGASIAVITDWFRFREVCDNDRMGVYFWNRLSIHRQGYKDMIRMQLANQSMDPIVNRYLESELIKTGKTTASGTQGFTRTDTRTTSGQSTSTGSDKRNGTKTTTGDTTQTRDLSSENTSREENNATYTKNRSLSEHTSHGEDRESYDGYTDALTKTGSEERATAYESTFTDAPKGKYTVTDTETPHGTKTVTTSHAVDTSSTTTREGAHTQRRNDLTSSRSANAAKAAPMSATGITRRTPGTEDNAYNTVLEGSIGDLDFQYASQYSEEDGQSGLTSEIKDEYQGEKGIVTTQGEKKNNIDETVEDYRKGEYNVEKTTETNYLSDNEADQYRVEHTRTGTDTDTTTFKERTDTRTIEGAKLFKRGDVDVTYGGTEGETATGGKIIDSRGTDRGTVTDTRNLTETTEDTGSTSGTVNESGTSGGSASGDTTTSSTRNDDESSRNRYTGREGLTPQDGLAAALQYLADYPNAIVWLINKLEPCFIGVYDI